MKEKIIKYEAVSTDNIHALNRLVNDLIALGYQPLGGVSSSVSAIDVCDVYYVNTQAMVLYKSEEE